MRNFTSLFVAVSLLNACSIKEVRDDCPCYTFVNLDEFIAAGFRDAILSYTSDELIMRDMVSLAPYEGVGFIQEMPRRKGRNAVIAGLKHCRVRSDSLLVPYGLEFDPIWMSGNLLFCEGDDYHVKALPEKQYCTINFIIEGMGDSSDYQYDYRLKADCNTMDIYSLKALEGPYCAIARRSAGGVYALRVPRQKASNLILEIIRQGNEDPLLAETIASIDLGKQFRAAAYDWEEDNLSDVSAIVDFGSSEVRLEIYDWTDDFNFNDMII